jgi:hypothetical protein
MWGVVLTVGGGVGVLSTDVASATINGADCSSDDTSEWTSQGRGRNMSTSAAPLLCCVLWCCANFMCGWLSKKKRYVWIRLNDTEKIERVVERCPG